MNELSGMTTKSASTTNQPDLPSEGLEPQDGPRKVPVFLIATLCITVAFIWRASTLIDIQPSMTFMGDLPVTSVAALLFARAALASAWIPVIGLVFGVIVGGIMWLDWHFMTLSTLED